MADLRESMRNLALQPIAYGQGGEVGDLTRGDPTVKAFYRQRIPGSSCERKETVDILVTSRNGDRKIMQSIRITSRPPSKKRKWNQLSQF